jgi:putative ABC transport system permease protein
MHTLLNDLKYSLRTLQHNPAFTITAVVALALGIGANTGIFSVVNAVLLRPLNAPDPDRIVQFMLTFPGGSALGGSAHHFYLWRRQTSDFQDVSAHRLELVNLTGGSNPEQIAAARVSADFFHLFGAAVLHGRTFTVDEDRPNAGHFVVLSYRLWKQRFGSDPQAVGKTVSIGGAPHLVLGILNRNFNSEQFDQDPDVWIPFQMDPNSEQGSPFVRVSARLRLGVTLGAAIAHLQVVANEFRREFPKLLGKGTGFSIEPIRSAMTGEVRSSLIVLFGAVAFVLLIACANVASLLLASAAGRKREIAIRAAVGAGRGQIIRQLLTESIVLSLAGGALGLVLGVVGIRALLGLYPSNPVLAPLNVVNIPRIGENGSAVTADWRVFTFTCVVSLLTAVLFGLVPALPASRFDRCTALKESSSRSGKDFRQNKSRALLVIGEVALALILLVGAALLIRTYVALHSVNPGFDSHNVLVMQMSLGSERFEKTSEVDRLVREGVQRIHTLPGVASVASSCCIPLETVWQLSFIVAGRPLNGLYHGFAGWTFISPEYFDTFHIRILRGRGFTERDDAGAPGVVVINQTMARQLWPKGDPLSDHLILGRGVRPEYDKDPARQIVGIVSDVRDVGLNRSPRPEMYVPIAQLPNGINALDFRLLPLAWIVRTRVEPLSLSSAIKEELRQATGMPVARIRSMDQVAAQSTARAQLNMLLMTIFGSSALMLAAIGIYGLMAYSVQQRTQEIGIRLALGANPGAVRKMVIIQGMRLAVLGVSIGIVLASGLTRLIGSLLFGVEPLDPIVFVSVPMILIVVALLAMWFPARRVTRIDPVDALRYE